jgi:hypothetical protein
MITHAFGGTEAERMAHGELPPEDVLQGHAETLRGLVGALERVLEQRQALVRPSHSATGATAKDAAGLDGLDDAFAALDRQHRELLARIEALRPPAGRPVEG